MTDPKTRRAGTLSPEMALLGQLYGAPVHGYDLHRRVADDLGHVWHLSQSQAYAILKRLEAGGDVARQEIPQQGLPSRQLLHLTEHGRARFLSWLQATSGGSTRAIRLEFVTRLYFLERHFPDQIAQAFERQRAGAQAHIHRLERTRAGLPAGQRYNRMGLDLRLRQLRAVLDWLGEIQESFPGSDER